MKHINLAKKIANHKAQQIAAMGMMAAMPVLASAAGIEDIGSSAATEIAKFAVMISAIGAAVLSIVVLIQGFKVAFNMAKTAR